MTDPNQPLAFPILIRFAKTGLMRFVGHLDFQAMQQAMFLRAGFKIVIGEGPSHRLRLKTSPPTPVGVESRCEFTYLMLSEQVYPEEAERRLNEQCPDGIEVVNVQDAIDDDVAKFPAKGPMRHVSALTPSASAKCHIRAF